MWRKEILTAIDKKQSITLRLMDGELLQGFPEGCTDRVKLRNDTGLIYIPLTDIKHMTRLIQFNPKKELTDI